jgi:Holliday junction DNA helicase RuvA
MIGKLTGTYGGTTAEGAVVIDVNGVGYVARVPVLTIDGLKTTSAAVSLYIHTVVREDALDLYGFMVEDELLFFKQLMSVSGIGPKTALGILNTADVPTLRRTIAQGDMVSLVKVFGIGKKSAERIVVELRDKMTLEQTVSGEPQVSGNDGDVLEALVAMGYSASEARSAIKSLPRTGNMQERIAAALKSIV